MSAEQREVRAHDVGGLTLTVYERDRSGVVSAVARSRIGGLFGDLVCGGLEQGPLI